jgi:hypothetical protein
MWEMYFYRESIFKSVLGENSFYLFLCWDSKQSGFLQAGKKGLDSRQGIDFSLYRHFLIDSRAQPAFYRMEAMCMSSLVEGRKMTVALFLNLMLFLWKA